MTDPYRTSLHTLARAVEAFLSAPRREAITRRHELIAALLRVGPLDESVPEPAASNDVAPVIVDYAIRFCEQLADLTPEESAWIERNLRPADEWEAFVDVHGRDAGPLFSELHALYARGDAFPEFDWRVEDDPVHGRRLRVWSDTFGNADHVVDLVTAFLARFRPAAVFTLAWVETCSAPRPGAFGGGAIVVTATGREYLALTEWLDARREAVERACSTACDPPAA